MAYRPSSASWQVCAESPHRAPVRYALGEMAHTVRARGGDLTVSLWGPKDGAWQRFDEVAASPPTPSTDREASGSPASAPERQPSTLTERMSGRRRQVLVAGLGKAGLYDLSPADWAAVEALADRLDETSVRTVARWLAVAGGDRGPAAPVR
ncbi:hypothetical protein [Streptomyces sp. NPDC006739]|uniref:hypothetical protein n=1 Tax=Streptomyces sp. NPDC006739 TaxID=3364763 RepID=UPI0036B425ED